ncbi:unnamed protein product, partial [Pleuronectes platessa]
GDQAEEACSSEASEKRDQGPTPSETPRALKKFYPNPSTPTGNKNAKKHYRVSRRQAEERKAESQDPEPLRKRAVGPPPQRYTSSTPLFGLELREDKPPDSLPHRANKKAENPKAKRHSAAAGAARLLMVLAPEHQEYSRHVPPHEACQRGRPMQPPLPPSSSSPRRGPLFSTLLSFADSCGRGPAFCLATLHLKESKAAEMCTADATEEPVAEAAAVHNIFSCTDNSATSYKDNLIPPHLKQHHFIPQKCLVEEECSVAGCLSRLAELLTGSHSQGVVNFCPATAPSLAAREDLGDTKQEVFNKWKLWMFISRPFIKPPKKQTEKSKPRPGLSFSEPLRSRQRAIMG